MGSSSFGASDVTRTRDLLITSEMHYRLCYTSEYFPVIILSSPGKVNSFLYPLWKMIAPVKKGCYTDPRTLRKVIFIEETSEIYERLWQGVCARTFF